jgi:MoaA/NifB/PqqE/SkfB family radical SAM enzyme
MSISPETLIHQFLPPEARRIAWRPHPMDGKLLLFDRDTGVNVLMDGDETRHFQRIAPRTLLIAVTNACNLTCEFCYRDLKSHSLWRYDSLLDFCQQADEWGVLEVAFGGGEPMLFPNWEQFIHDLYETTQLCVNFTTNGMLLTEDFLKNIEGKYGQIRLSMYDTNHPDDTIGLLVNNGARFGVNWLISPDTLPTLEDRFMQLIALGVRDFLLISYKGQDSALHLSPEQIAQFSQIVNRMYERFGQMLTIKLDVCWGDSLPEIPRLFIHDDCGAGDDFLSITSDKHVKACSFQQTHAGLSFDTITDVRQIWENRRNAKQAARVGGCARLTDRGQNLVGNGDYGAFISLDTIK